MKLLVVEVKIMFMQYNLITSNQNNNKKE